MPAETANGLPYPLDSDAPDGAAQIKALAEAIDQIPTALIADLAVTEGKLGNASVATAKLIDLAVTTIKLANEAVTEAKLGNLAVATAKLANLAVTAAKLGNESVETGKLQALAVTTAKLAGGAVTEEKLGAALKTLVVTQPVRSTVEQLKTIRGIVDTTGAGSIVEGLGFSLTRKAEGDVEITFTSAFSDVPTVIPSGQGATVSYGSNLAAPTASTARLGRWGASSKLTDGILHFVALGPR